MENPDLIIQPPSPTESTQFNLLNFWETLQEKIEHSCNTNPKETLTTPKNPFHHHINVNFCRKLVIIFFTIFILPFKVVGIFICLILSWLFASLALAGVPLKKLSAKRLSSSRRFGRRLAHFFLRCAFFCLGFLWVTVKGKRASPAEAPIMVVGPHTSLFDTLLLLAVGHPTASPVAKLATHNIPLIGKMIDVTQPVYVQRDSSNSRRSAAREIRDRVKPFKIISSEDKTDVTHVDPDPDADDNSHNPIRELWTQIFIFPEGTCANKKYLLKFKLGAFLPGVPVQPIVVKWPSKLDSTTWTFDGPHACKLLWLTACQFFHRVHIQYLPVYKPSPAEVKDARLYSRNVQQLMSAASGLPTVDNSYEDGLLYMKIKYKTPLLKHLKKVRKFQFRYRVKKQPPPLPNQKDTTKNNDCTNSSDIDIILKLLQIFQRHSQSEPVPELHFTWSVSIPEFCKILNINLKAGTSQETKARKKLFALFSLYSNLNNNNHDTNFKGRNNDELHREKAAVVHSDIDIDIREYFIHTLLLVYPKLSADELATVIFALYGNDQGGGGGESPLTMDTSILSDTLRRVLYLPDDYVDSIMLGGFGLNYATSTSTNITGSRSEVNSQNQTTNTNAQGIFDAGLLDDTASHDPDNVLRQADGYPTLVNIATQIKFMSPNGKVNLGLSGISEKRK